MDTVNKSAVAQIMEIPPHVSISGQIKLVSHNGASRAKPMLARQSMLQHAGVIFCLGR